MRTLVKQLLDQDISRRGFVKELAALGVSLSSAQALLNSISPAVAAETTEAGLAKEVTGNGPELLAESLMAAGVTNIFHGCGGGINKIFDAFVTRPEFKNFLATNEGQCVAMAEGYHIASGELGVVIVPRPGLCNAGSNIHNAMADRSSLLILTARENNDYSQRRGNIEIIEWQDVMDPFMKWSYRMEHVDRVPEFTRRAIKVASAPLGGPTFLQISEELYKQQGQATIYPQQQFRIGNGVKPDTESIEAIARLLLEAQKPLITVGLEVTKSGGASQMIELAELLGLPVTQGLSLFADFPNHHPLFLGPYSPYLGYKKDVDLYVVIGAQMPDVGHYIVTGPPPAGAKIVHISLDPDLLAVSQPTELSIMADSREVIADLIEAIKSLATKRKIDSIRNERYPQVQEYVEAQRQRTLRRAQRTWDQAPITYARLSTELNDALEDDAIVVSEPLYGVPEWFDLGYGKKTMIGPSPGEILGWATGAAFGVKLAKPDSQVVALSGDGAFMFQNSLWSHARYHAPVITVVYNNQAYNMNRAFGWLSGGAQADMEKDLLTYLGDPDMEFSIVAKGHGVDGERVDNPSELGPAIQRAIKATKDGNPYLLDVRAERYGKGGHLTWHPEISIADMRTRKI
jgi:thiamine pyrophosphate-dependent acetolactate synthase large subunit-like protein